MRPLQFADQRWPSTLPVARTVAPAGMTFNTLAVVLCHVRIRTPSHFAVQRYVAASASWASVGRTTITARTATRSGGPVRASLHPSPFAYTAMMGRASSSVSSPTVLLRTDHDAGPGP